jgi:fluoroquinolone resistance protein
MIANNDHVSGCRFEACTFTKCSFREAVFEDCVFQECNFRDCDLSLISLCNCRFNNTRFTDSKIIGVSWVDTNLAQSKSIFAKPVDFIKCVLNHSIFLGLNLSGAKLTHCIAREVSFEESNLSLADCSYTDFSGSRFLHTVLTKADFTGATNYIIASGLNTLKQTRFSLPEALSILYNLDIILTDPQTGEIETLP